MRKPDKLWRYTFVKKGPKTIHLIGTTHIGTKEFYDRSNHLLEIMRKRNIPICEEGVEMEFKGLITKHLQSSEQDIPNLIRNVLIYTLLTIFLEYDYKRKAATATDDSGNLHLHRERDKVNLDGAINVDVKISDFGLRPTSWLGIYWFLKSQIQKINENWRSEALELTLKEFVICGNHDFRRERKVIENVLQIMTEKRVSSICIHFGMKHIKGFLYHLRRLGWSSTNSTTTKKAKRKLAYAYD